MTTRKKALIELRDAVKTETATEHHFAAAFPSESAYGVCTWHHAIGAYRKSIDAAKALHEAVLPLNCTFTIYKGDDCYGVSVGRRPLSLAKHPARAWLLAIFEALIAQEPDT